MSEAVQHKRKLFDIENLRVYNDNVFIIQRALKKLQEEHLEQQDIIYKYDRIISEVEHFLKLLQKQNVPAASGIAICMKQHTPATCILLLGILNHNCYFHTIDDIDTTMLQERGISYVVMPHKAYEPITDFIILKQHFYLNKISNEQTIPTDICYTLTTTGSTGKPKVVHVPYNCIALNIEALSAQLELCANDVIYLCAPPTFDPFIVEFFLATQNGAALLISDAELRLKPEKLIEVLFPRRAEKLSCTLLQMTPSLFRCFGADIIRTRILHEASALRVLLLGGECFPAVAELKTWLTSTELLLQHKRLYNIYGITEMSCWATIQRLLECHFTMDSVPLGAPIETDTKLRIIKENGQQLAVGETGIGALWLGSARRCCYIPEIDITVTRNQSVLYRATGDLVRQEVRGDIYYIGRSNDVIKRAGKRLCLATLSRKITQLIASEVHCLWQAEQRKLICVIESAKKHLSNEARRQQNAKIIKQLTPEQQPDAFIYLGATLPLNRHGKLDKQALLALCAKQLAMPKTPVSIFETFISETLGMDYNELATTTNAKRAKMSKDISFRQAGASSYQALSLATEIGALLEATAQRRLLEMLLNEKISISNILEFLAASIPKVQQISKANTAKNNCFKFNLNWRADFSKCIDAAVAIFENNIAVGSHAAILQTINTENGAVVSSLKLPDRIECKVAWLRADFALVGCYDAHLYAFQPENGCILWKLHLGGMIKAQPLYCAAGKQFIVGSYAPEYNLVCIELETQKFKWQLNMGVKGIYAAPIALADDSVLVCTLECSYAAINTLNGSIKWLQYCKSPIFATPILLPLRENFALAEVAGIVHICAVATGVQLISYKAAGNIFSSFALQQQNAAGDCLILFGCHDHCLYCLQYAAANATLQLHWRLELNAAIFATPILLTPPTLEEICVLCCTTKGLISLIKLSNGNIIAEHIVDAEIFSTPACIANKRIFIGCRDNFLYSFLLEQTAGAIC